MEIKTKNTTATIHVAAVSNVLRFNSTRLGGRVEGCVSFHIADSDGCDVTVIMDAPTAEDLGRELAPAQPAPVTFLCDRCDASYIHRYRVTPEVGRFFCPECAAAGE
jgi:hypothetical protein